MSLPATALDADRAEDRLSIWRWDRVSVGVGACEFSPCEWQQLSISLTALPPAIAVRDRSPPFKGTTAEAAGFIPKPKFRFIHIAFIGQDRHRQDDSLPKHAGR